MKFVFLTVVIFWSFGCSFKTNKNLQQEPGEAEALLKAITNDAEDSVLKKIDSFTTSKIISLNLEEKALDKALIRGNSTIITYLLKSGISPYRNNIYLTDSKYPERANDLIRSYNGQTISKIEELLDTREYSKLQNSMSALGIKCEVMLNLHSQFNLVKLLAPIAFNADINALELQQKQESLIEYLSTDVDCKNLKYSFFKNEWIHNEILRSAYIPDGYKFPSTFKFLVSLFDTSTFSFVEEGDKPGNIEPTYLIRQRIFTAGLKDSEIELLMSSWFQPLEEISKEPNLFIRSKGWPYIMPMRALKIITESDFLKELHSKYYTIDVQGNTLYLTSRIKILPLMIFAPQKTPTGP